MIPADHDSGRPCIRPGGRIGYWLASDSRMLSGMSKFP